MVVKIYISGISGNKEVKKRQQRVLMILDSKGIKYEVVDITEPGCDEDKEFMQLNSTSLGATVGDAAPRHPLPPQIFNDSSYCGDYDQFDMSNEIDELEKFLKVAPDDSAPTVTSSAEIQLGNGDSNKQNVDEEETNEAEAVTEDNEAEAVQPEETNGKSDDLLNGEVEPDQEGQEEVEEA